MIVRHYILEGREVKEVSTEEWAKWWFQSRSMDLCRVALTELEGSIKVSTVFLGLSAVFGDELPRMFETMVFGGDLDGHGWRSTTWEEAEKTHREVIKEVWREHERKCQEDV